MAGIFKRVEKKYLLTSEQGRLLIEKLGDRIEDDMYSDYTICNIYYDTEGNDLIRRSLAKPKFKEKFRLRCYGEAGEDSMVFLELKKKWRGVVYKRRVEMPLKDAELYLSEHIYPQKYDCQILKEIDYAIGFYRLVPKVFLAYDRKAYVVKDMPEIRFTLDERIRSRKTEIDLKKGSHGDLLYEDNMKLLEIKAPAALPIWFADILAELDIYSTSFSKYGRVYESRLKDDLEERDEENDPQIRYTMQQLEGDSAKNRTSATAGALA
ncbi:MAG: polyphosphate polymerase domain-containing protein [Lachnospiraceae bacterium]|nr:polyphosphate polymerase domain-containing protein [Lachnospiraceae bacterium]